MVYNHNNPLCILKNLKKNRIENIFIYVCDSLRWDYLPDYIADKGVVIKTIASSLFTAPSFASLVTGLYPPRHGVNTWCNRLVESAQGLLKIKGYCTSLWCETTWTHLPPDDSPIHDVLGKPKGTSLDSIPTPFIYIEDDKGGHAPYGYSFDEWRAKGYSDFNKDFYVQVGKEGRDELRRKYQLGIKKSIDRFMGRIQILKKRNLDKNTLIIFTSDHGELLGEYGGLVGHERPACPELVYVPTVFIHPSLNGRILCNGIIRHVDFYPTIMGILRKERVRNVDGIDLVAVNKIPTIGLNFKGGSYIDSKSRILRCFDFVSGSAWDFFGGYVFHRLHFLNGLLLFIYKICISSNAESHFMRESARNDKFSEISRKYLTAVKHFILPCLQYYNPRFTRDMAKEYIRKYYELSRKQYSRAMPLNETMKDKLKSLGYFE